MGIEKEEEYVRISSERRFELYQFPKSRLEFISKIHDLECYALCNTSAEPPL